MRNSPFKLSCPPKVILPKGTLAPNSGNISKAMQQSQTIQQNKSCGLYGVVAGPQGPTGPRGPKGDTGIGSDMNLSEVLSNGDSAGTNDIDMNQRNIYYVSSIGNTNSTFSIHAPNGLELDGDVGMPTYVFTSNGNTQPKWEKQAPSITPPLSEVLVQGNTASSYIDMSEYGIKNVSSIGNNSSINLITPSVQLNSVTGTSGQVFTINDSGPTWSDVSDLYNPTLSEVLNNGNTASKDIDMREYSITNVSSIGNTASTFSIHAPNGLELDGDVGSTGYVFTSNGIGQPSWLASSSSSLNYYSDDYNIFLVKKGQTAGNVSGYYNTAIGYEALKGNNSFYNTAIGFQALYDSSGDSNTAIGYNSLYTNTVGNYNTAIGYNSLYNTTGSNNIAIGNSSGSTNTTGSNNIFIGSDTNTNTDSQIIIGSIQTDTTIYSNNFTIQSPTNYTVCSIGDVSDVSGNLNISTINFGYTSTPILTTNQLGYKIYGIPTATSISPSTTTAYNINSINITAGTWIVSYQLTFNEKNPSGTFLVGIGTSNTFEYAVNSRQFFISTSTVVYPAINGSFIYETPSSTNLYLNVLYEVGTSPLTINLNTLSSNRIA